MNFTVDSKIIAAVSFQPASLVPLLGAFEIVLPFACQIHGMTEGKYRWLAISGVRVYLRAKSGQLIELGTARSDNTAEIRQMDYATEYTNSFKLLFQAYQLEMLEAARDGGDLNLLLRFLACGGTTDCLDWRPDQNQSDMNVSVPESSWIEQLKSSKAANILLFEVKLPMEGGYSHPAVKHLITAQQLFVGGDWRQCVSECRQFAEQLGGNDLAPAIDRLSTDRRSMTKSERETVITAALQHYGHISTHSESRQGELDYSRSDARLALSVAASLAAHQFGQG